MPTVEEKLRALTESQTRLSKEKPKTWKQKQKAKLEYEFNQNMIVQLKKFQQLKVNDWVTNKKQVGQIKQLFLSPGGMPEAYINWLDSALELDLHHDFEQLIVLEENWNHGFSLTDLVRFHLEGTNSTQLGTIVKFAWSEEVNCVLPVVKEDETEKEILVLWENLTKVEDKQELSVLETENEANSINNAEIYQSKVEKLTKEQFDNSPMKENKSSLSSSRQIIIDPEFKSLIPVLSEEEKSQLENNIISEGCRDPLVIWKGYNILLDGHNRYEICVKNGINYELIEIELPNREEAHLWMMRNQLGRRNLQPEALSYFRGKLHQVSKQKVSNSSGSNQYSPQNEVKSQNDTQLNNTDSDQYNEVDCHNVSQPKSDQKETAFTLSKNLNVSPRTIYRDSQYAKAVDAIASVMGEEIRPKILSKRTEKKLTKKKTLELAKLAKRKPEEVIEYFNPKPVEKSNPEKLKPFPFKVGEVVKIIPKSEPDLRGKGDYWAIITKVHLTCCDLQLWNGTVEFISAEHLVSLNLSPSECEQMKVLCVRLNNIKEVADDPIVNHNLQFLGHLKHPKLTETQQKMLEYLENLHEDTCIDNSKTKEKLNDLNIADDFESTKNEPLTITNNPESINNKFGKIERNNSDLTNNESLVQP